jgi:NAD(P)H-hydrate epimerase
MRVLSRDQMREADRQTIEDLGVSGDVLMERAGRQVAAAIAPAFGTAAGLRVTVLCGRGNNGGDGFVAARVLQDDGAAPRVFIAGLAADVRGDARHMLDRLLAAGGRVLEVPDEAAWDAGRDSALDADVIVDALTGTGLVVPIDGLMRVMVEDVNAAGVPVVSVDLPSGLSADRHHPIGPAIAAAMTVTFAAPKLPLVAPPADRLAGALVVADIGIPASVIEGLPGPRIHWITSGDARARLPVRAADSNKGDYGRVVIVAGSRGRTGAAALAGLAALRSGAGLVTIATPASCLATVAAHAPEFMTEGLPETAGGTAAEQALPRVLAIRADVVAVGPGLGRAASTTALVHGLIDAVEGPLVLDADALNALEGDAGRLARRAGRVTVVTPHPGEMARLTGLTVAGVQADRLEVARQFAADHGVVVVLKGHRTVVAVPGGGLSINSTGNPGMATGGTGDVLTGMIAAWLGQIPHPADAAAVAVFLHGLAGDLAADAIGETALIASDLIAHLGEASRVVRDRRNGVQGSAP